MYWVVKAEVGIKLITNVAEHKNAQGIDSIDFHNYLKENKSLQNNHIKVCYVVIKQAHVYDCDYYYNPPPHTPPKNNGQRFGA